MASAAQKRAVESYRTRLAQRGVARFEIQAPAEDRSLLRDLARKLADEGPEAEQLRSKVQQAMSGAERKKGGILEAFRRSPLVGADIDLSRDFDFDRKADL